MSTAIGSPQKAQVVSDSSTVRSINNLFNSSKTRLDGWRLLNSFLPQCPDEDFIQFCVSWMQNCCKIDGLFKEKDIAINLLGNLFKVSSNYQELKKPVSLFITSQYFDFFYKYLLESPAGWNCTKNCLLFYRGACGSFQDGLQKQLMFQIDKNLKISKNISECFALLPCTGGGGNDCINYKRNWKNQFLKILSICHSILNDLFADAEEFKMQEYETLEHTYNKMETPANTDYLVTQLHNYTSILNRMLLDQYPAPKPIPSDLIFQLVCRGLALNPKSLAKHQTTEYMALQKVLPEVQYNFLSVLKAVIITCKNLLLPYSYLICKLIKQILEWTEGDSINKAFVRLRVSVYETVCNWLTVARNGSCVETISNTVISSAVNDFRSKKAVIFLKGKHQNKSREVTPRGVDPTANSKLCYSALKCLQFLLKFSGVSIKPEEHKFLQEVVVELLLEIQKGSAADVIAPFLVPECRRELYSLLLELVHQPCTKWPPPTHFALRLFSEGVNDSSPDVSSFCSAALNFTTIIIHPQYDNGGFSASEPGVNGHVDKELPWMQELDSEKGRVDEENSNEAIPEAIDCPESVVSDLNAKLSYVNEETDISSEDSRATVKYSQDVKPNKENVDEVSENVQESQNDDEPAVKKPKISTEEPPPDETCTLTLENTPETPPTNNKNNKDKSEESTQESPSEERHPKKRYFLRSKMKEASEESEEAQKSSSSLESGEATPLRSVLRTPAAHSANRPKTRALSKIETEAENEPKAGEKNEHDKDDVDDEYLKEVFDDSLVDNP